MIREKRLRPETSFHSLSLVSSMFFTETKELKEPDLGQHHSRLHVWQSSSDGIPGGARRKGYKRIKYEYGDILK